MFVRDVRLAVRSLRRIPGFSIAVIASLSLGLTFVASTVAIVNAYLVRPLPYRNADRLFHVSYAPPGPWEPANVAAIDWGSLRDVVDAPITASGSTFYIGESGYSAPARGLRAGPEFIDGLGVRPILGRPFNQGDYDGAGEQVALIGNALWRGQFGGDSAVVGRRFRADVEGSDNAGQSYRIIGVLPPGFWFGRESSSTIDVMVPLREPVQTYMARLRPGVPATLAERRITEATRRVVPTLPANWTGVHLESMRDRYVATMRPILLGITIAAALVLVIVCANVAVLTLLRTMRRQKEIGVRIALGAGWSQVARMLAAETILLCATSVAIAILLTSSTLRALGPIVENYLGRPAPHGTTTITVDTTVFAIVGGSALLIALSLTLLPLLTPWQRRLAGTLRSAGRSATDSPSMRRARFALIGFEIAGSLVLLAACVSMIRSVATMLHSELGFRDGHVARAAIVVPGRAYPDSNAMLAFYRRLSTRTAALTNAPIAFHGWPPYIDFPPRPFTVEGHENEQSSAGYVAVGPDYFTMLSIPIRQGRQFLASDLPSAAPVAIVSEELARKLWPGESAVGRRIRSIEPGTATVERPWRTVVGVVGNVRQTYSDEDTRDIYVPFYQASPGRYGAFYMRSDLPAPVLLEQLRKSIAEADPLAIVRWVNTMASEDQELPAAKFVGALLTTIAVFAVLLALLGIYGVMAYAVRQREREIAIRIAVGATGRNVMTLFLRHGGRVLAIGIAVGLVASAAAGRILASKFTTAKEFDWLTIIAAAGFMVITGLVAVWWPARRAMTTNPAMILNEE